MKNEQFPTPDQTPESMGELESMQAYDAILMYAQEAVVGEDEAVDYLAGELQEMKKSVHAAHYLDKLDPDQYHSATKLLNDTARERLRKAFAKIVG